MESIHATLPCLHITGAWKEDAWALGTRPSKSQPRSQDLYPGLGVAWGHGVAWGCGGKRENLRTALTWGTTDKELLTSSNQRLWECVRCRINLYPDTLNDFPSWLSLKANLVSSTTVVLQKAISVTKSMPVWLIDDCVAWRRQFP